MFSKMKKLLAISALISWSILSFAGPAEPSLHTYTQPDGSTVYYYLHGDEHLNWMTTENGDVIEIGEDGYVRPATMPTESRFKMAAQKRHQSVSKRSGTQTGERHFMVVLVQYPDLEFIKSKSEYEDFFNGVGAGSTASVQTYFNEQSDGQFMPIFDVYGPVTLSKNRAEYKYNPREAFGEALDLMVKDGTITSFRNYAVKWMSWEARWTGFVEDVIMIFAGHSRASGDDDGIWPCSVSSGTLYKGSADGYYIVESFCCAPELQGASGTTMAGIGHVCHEFGHRMGLPDFYDTNSSAHGGNVAHACMDYSLMGSGSYNNYSKTPPPLSMYEKSICGWANMEDIPEISSSGNLTLYEIGQGSDKTRAFIIPTDKSGEVFICEYHSTNSGVNKWGASLQRGGLLVYHLDGSDREITQDGETKTAAEWLDYGRINNNGSHPLFYLISSGNPSNLKATDGQQIPFPGSQNIVNYNPVSWNNTASYVSLSGLSYTAVNSSMNLKAHVRSFPLINNPKRGSYSAGNFTLKLSPGSSGSESVTTWYYDGEQVESSEPRPVITLTTGPHVIEAVLSSGKRLRLELSAQ